jgi:hypothetical protein
VENSLKKQTAVTALVLLTLAVGVTASTKLIASWNNPKFNSQQFKRILVIGMSNNLETRADFEDALASKMTRPGLKAIPGNNLLLRPTAGPLDLGYIREQIKEHNIDGVVVSRLVKVDTSVTYIPGQAYFLPYYNSFYGYYGAVYPVVYSPGYLSEEKKVRVETNLYAITAPDGELVWTGTSDTFNPSSAHKAIGGIVQLVVREFEKQGILPNGKSS